MQLLGGIRASKGQTPFLEKPDCMLADAHECNLELFNKGGGKKRIYVYICAVFFM